MARDCTESRFREVLERFGGPQQVLLVGELWDRTESRALLEGFLQELFPGELADGGDIFKSKGAPQEGTPEHVSQRKGAPQQGTPEHVSQCKGAPQQGTPEHVSQCKGAPQQGTPEHVSQCKGTPQQGTPEHVSQCKGAPQQGTPDHVSQCKGAPQQVTSDHVSQCKGAPQQVTSDHVSQCKGAPQQVTSDHVSQCKGAPQQGTPEHVSQCKGPPQQLTSDHVAQCKGAPQQVTSDHVSQCKGAPQQGSSEHPSKCKEGTLENSSKTIAITGPQSPQPAPYRTLRFGLVFFLCRAESLVLQGSRHQLREILRDIRKRMPLGGAVVGVIMQLDSTSGNKVKGQELMGVIHEDGPVCTEAEVSTLLSMLLSVFPIKSRGGQCSEVRAAALIPGHEETRREIQRMACEALTAADEQRRQKCKTKSRCFSWRRWRRGDSVQKENLDEGTALTVLQYPNGDCAETTTDA